MHSIARRFRSLIPLAGGLDAAKDAMNTIEITPPEWAPRHKGGHPAEYACRLSVFVSAPTANAG